MDLRDFFASIGRGADPILYRTLGYPTPVARLLAGLSTTCVPLREWSLAPKPRDEAEARSHWLAGRFYCAPHLPQGAPTSPALANLCAFRLDLPPSLRRRARFGATYTRYADDIALSGELGFERRALHVYSFACRIASEEGLRRQWPEDPDPEAWRTTAPHGDRRECSAQRPREATTIG